MNLQLVTSYSARILGNCSVCRVVNRAMIVGCFSVVGGLNCLAALPEFPPVISFPSLEKWLPPKQCGTPSPTLCRGCLDIAGEMSPCSSETAPFRCRASNWQVRRSGLSRNTGSFLASSAHFGARRLRTGQVQMNRTYGGTYCHPRLTPCAKCRHEGKSISLPARMSSCSIICQLATRYATTSVIFNIS